MSTVSINDRVCIGGGGPLAVIAGPCVLESRELTLKIGRHMAGLCGELGLSYIFKASYDKANRSSGESFRGPGMAEGLEILREIREELGVPTLTDIHDVAQVAAAADVVDILQIPAFLCRQTDLLLAAARSGKAVNIKKGQFMAPEGMRGAVDKVRGAGNPRVLLTERGTTFGYGNLVVDMRSLAIMREMSVPVVFDATHSVQLPGGLGHASGGQREFILPLARAAAAVGIDALFLEVHPEPAKALSDGPNSADFALAARILREVAAIHELAR
jgi:2-dehydro-3-deoxyphosphooctonate aldolase (KDO 8-P synthase)